MCVTWTMSQKTVVVELRPVGQVTDNLLNRTHEREDKTAIGTDNGDRGTILHHTTAVQLRKHIIVYNTIQQNIIRHHTYNTM